MQKISQLICLIVFLVFVATNCMARTVENQAGIDDGLHRLIKKRQTDLGGCRPCDCHRADHNCCPCPDCCGE